MAGDTAGVSPESTPETEWVSLMKNLEPAQIAEIFDGLCPDCHALLKSRLLHKRNTVLESGKLDFSNISSSETSTESTPAKANQRHSSNEGTPIEKSTYSVGQERNSDTLSPSPAKRKPQARDLFDSELSSPDGKLRPPVSNGFSEDEEWHRFSLIGRKKNFVHYERVNGKDINVLQGLELHTGVFNAEEQKKIVESVYNFQRMGRKGQLMARTYSEPTKWMRGKGRVTIQFGCCYNYAVDKDGNPPGIIRDEDVDPLPPVFKEMIIKMVRWHVLPPTCIPNSCIVNIYDEGDCIPPHIDHHDFLRPFCTVSFLTECNILFGTNLKVVAPGEFSGPVPIPLPIGSVLILKGNGADVAKHCVPAVPAKRISVTFRRMDDSKIPYNFSPDPELLNLIPLVRTSPAKASMAVQDSHNQQPKSNGKANKWNAKERANSSFVLQNDDFPPLGGLRLGNR